MPNERAERIWTTEGKYTFRSTNLAEILAEIDARTSCRDSYEVVTRNASNLITKIEVFSDPAKTQLSMRRDFGYDANDRIVSFTDIYFNEDSSEDSRVTQTLTRDANGRITECAAVFSTTEDVDC